MKRLIITFNIIIVAVIMMIGPSCSKMDAYKKYEGNGEIVYPGIFDSLKVISGKNRALITGIMLSDPKVSKYKIFWNGGSDSITADFKRSGGVDTMKQMINDLPEGELTFEIRTYDSLGNRSVPMNVSGSVYGSSFQNSIDLFGNRTITATQLTLSNSLQLAWQDIDSYTNIVGMNVQYYNFNGVQIDTLIAAQLEGQVTVLQNVDISKPVVYNTLFIPDTLDLDTLSVSAVAAPSVSEIVIPNSINPYQTTTTSLIDGRWGNLTDWIINDEAKNHGGVGGFSLDGDGALIDLEAGWGSGPILNGKLYQTCTLPAGNYTLDASPLVWNGINDPVYLTVATKLDSLPDYDKVPTMPNVFYSKLKNTQVVQFKLQNATQIAFGFQANYIQDGQGFKVKQIHLYYAPL